MKANPYFALALITMLSPPKAFANSVAPAPAKLGISRFVEVEPGFARGGRPSEADVRALAARGYKTVVSLRHGTLEGEWVRSAGMEFIQIPMDSGPFGAPAPSEAQVRTFLAAVGDPAKRPVFVHCKRGRDRTGVMVALYRVARNGWSAEQAIAEMEERGIRPQYQAYRRYVRNFDPGTMAAESE